MKPIRVLVVDDSAFMRRVIRQILEGAPDIEVVDVARDGQEGMEKAITLQPDVVTLDINMPRMDGLTALQHITLKTTAKVVMISSLTQEDALITFEALELGAVDFIAKPDGTISLGISRLADEIIGKVRAAAKARLPKRTPGRRVSRVEKQIPVTTITDLDWVVLIGVSTGGPRTLEDILPHLPGDLPAGVVVVQHMPPRFTASLAQRLDQYCKLHVCEAREGMKLSNGLAVFAPGGYHLMFRQQGGGITCYLSLRPEDAQFRPSVDVTLHALMETYDPKRTIGVLLTGMGDDGADAMVELRRRGGWTVVESEETAVVWGMPRAAIERGGADVVAPSYQIADIIRRKVGGR
ncbi:protein-glutamate methylesterase/protein-glutamine glutaminase [Neomoorella mulderi]|uniref:Protein-glutamate methylesterase/protein-glutamine glutaminase n=1 Tax=Moorella mulderi DSM 14980 TaxID=1122241 RepID=A0A151AVJ2_9FIRM|nr:chemotaxis response regulator protein-glutamate methylesterase [Moorella mulderi]KYH31582.1 chemotaxis response regulator protein-glutamate methylesterase [Moorella mulderi DSM 14980]